jgi:hypothetical protein
MVHLIWRGAMIATARRSGDAWRTDPDRAARRAAPAFAAPQKQPVRFTQE